MRSIRHVHVSIEPGDSLCFVLLRATDARMSSCLKKKVFSKATLDFFKLYSSNAFSQGKSGHKRLAKTNCANVHAQGLHITFARNFLTVDCVLKVITKEGTM